VSVTNPTRSQLREARAYQLGYGDAVKKVEAALTRLANPTVAPRSEEAARLQIEVAQIAHDALARLNQ
jgi:hypothetical protein